MFSLFHEKSRKKIFKFLARLVFINNYIPIRFYICLLSYFYFCFYDLCFSLFYYNCVRI